MPTADEAPAPAGRAAAFRGRGAIAAAGLIGILIGAGGVALASRDAPSGSREDVERIVRDYVLANPELIPEAMQALHDKQAAKAVAANRAALEKPFASAWAGAADGDVVLVEFFDYACGYCRKSNADVEQLLAEDAGLKVVWREWPVLGQDSLAAAEASLAAAEQGKFRSFFHQMFEAGRPSGPALSAAQGRTGIRAGGDTARFRAEIENNHELARQLGATGTPTFIVGDKVLQGAVGYDALKQAIAEARAT